MTSENDDPDLGVEDISRFANEVVNECVRALEAGDFPSAATIAIEGIKEICRHQATAPKYLAPHLYAVRILFNGMRDLANLRLSTDHRTWLKTPLAVESAWLLAHDASDRLLDRQDLGSDFQEYCERAITEVIEAINGQYGEGLYVSWEVEIKRLECTVCGTDTRKCAHMPGTWYDGVLCQQRIDDLEPVALAIVERPRDPRCRIWPWLVEKEKARFFDVTFFFNFRLEGDVDGGKVLDKSDIFPTIRTTLQQSRSSIRYDVYAYRKLKRAELIETVRQCIAQHKLNPKPKSRVRFYTLVGSHYWDRHVASENLSAESA